MGKIGASSVWSVHFTGDHGRGGAPSPFPVSALSPSPAHLSHHGSEDLGSGDPGGPNCPQGRSFGNG